MRHRLWSVAVAGLALGSLAMVGGTAIGGQVAAIAVGYGLLISLAALYLIAGLAIRERVWRQKASPSSERLSGHHLAGRRVF